MAQIATIRLETGTGTIDVPVFSTGDSGTTVIEALRSNTPSGVGFIPLAPTADATYDYARVETGSGTYAIHDAASVGPSMTVVSTLNGGSATLTVYEDTNLDGTAENSETVTLTGGTEDFSLGTLTGGAGNDYWIYADTEPADETSRVEISSIDLEVPV